MKLGVCVPYRNRELHLNEFVPKVSKYLKEKGIDFHMYLDTLGTNSFKCSSLFLYGTQTPNFIYLL
jgi:hypothetical protein